jgi:hypothetical protein
MGRDTTRHRTATESSDRRRALRALQTAIVIFGENIDEGGISFTDFLRLLDSEAEPDKRRSKTLRVRWVEEW